MRVRMFAIGLGALCLTAATAVQAAEAPEVSPRPVTLEALVAGAMQRSPALVAKRRAYEAAQASILSAGLPDDPMAGVDVEGQSGFFDLSSRGNHEYMLSQTIPFPTKLLLSARIAAKEAAMAYQAYQEEARQVVWHIEEPYYRLLLAQQTLRALEEVRALAEKSIAAARARYESNQASQQDLLKAQIELAKLDIERFNWQEQRRLAEAHLAHILNEPLSTTYAPEEPPARQRLSDTPEALEQAAIASRPELQMLARAIERAKAQRLLSFTSWLPDITGRLEARQFRGEDGLREKDTAIFLSVPVWSLLKGAGGDWKAAVREVQAAEATYDEMKNEVWLAIREAHSQVRATEYALQRYDTVILPQTRQQAAVALAGYEAGAVDFLMLVDAQRMWREAQIAYYGLAAEHAVGLAALRVAVGTPLAITTEGDAP